MGKIPSHRCLIYIGGYDLTGNSVGMVGPSVEYAVVDGTTITDTAERAVATISKSICDYKGFFDNTAGLSKDAFTALINSYPVVSLLLGSAAAGPAAGNVCFSGSFLQTSQVGDPIPLKGLVGFRANLLSDSKADIGNLLQVSVTKTTNFNGAGVDNGASSANGGMLYVHVFASDGTATIKLQHSNNDGGGDPYADLTGASYSAPSGRSSGTGLVATGTTVKEWLRAVLTLGTATSVTYAVIFARR